MGKFFNMSHFEILKLSQLKKPFKTKKKFFIKKWKSSSSFACDDKCSIHIEKISPKVENIQVVHEGCILSRAATNAIIAEIEKKSYEDAKKIILDFKSMLEGKRLDLILPAKLLLFKKFNKFPSRWNCLLVGANLILKILDKKSTI